MVPSGDGMYSLTGERDHSPFGQGGVKLAWGELPDGTHVHISAVPAGHGCGCTCPACGLPLSAHKGTKLVHHFHHLGGQACSSAGETNAHVWAKQILAERKQIWLPAVIAEAGGQRREEHRARLLKFASAELEKRDGSIVPDVKLIYRDSKGHEHELIVEILVTHACDDEKIEKIKRQGVSAIEIDLGRFRRSKSEEIVACALIGDDPLSRAPRHWLHNPKRDVASERLATEQVRVAAERKKRAERAERAREAELSQRAGQVIQAAKSIRRVSTEATLDDHEIVNLYDLLAFADLDFGGHGFRVSNLLWQSAILSRLLVGRMNETRGPMSAINVGLAIRTIHDCLAADVPSEPPQNLRMAILAVDPEFVFAGEAIERYLGRLELFGLLEREYVWHPKGQRFVGWCVSDRSVAQFRERRASLAEQRRRSESACAKLARIVERVPPEERATFSLDLWFEQPIEGHRGRFSDLVHRGGQAWSDFERDLRQIELMFRDGPPAKQTLGLPVGQAIARAAERERLKQEEAERIRITAEAEAANKRSDHLLYAAINALGDANARRWLVQKLPNGTRLSVASQSDIALGQAMSALAAEKRDQMQRERLAREAAECRRLLKEAAASSLGPDSERVELFMQTTHPRLGASPWSRCVDRRGLDECLALLPRGTAQRVSKRVRW